MINFVLGAIVGIILALTGAGGGILAVPLLIFGAHLRVADASPIGLLAVGLSAALGAILGLKAGTVRYRAALLIATAGMLWSPAGLWLAHRIDNQWLSIVFALVLLYVGVRTFHRAKGQSTKHADSSDRHPPCIRHAETGRFIWTSRCAGALASSGTIAGLLSGLLGVGGGFVIVPALQRYTDLKIQPIVATSLAVIALVSVAGVTSSALTGHLDWSVALPFSLGALAGMTGGRMIASRLAGPHMQKGFGIVSATVAIGMIVKAVI